jgi:alkylated DNA repair protein (DNA oxidative demethylase)
MTTQRTSAGTNLALFDDIDEAPRIESLATGAIVWRNGAREFDRALLAAVDDVTAQAPWRHLITPGGFRMSVSMTSCGDAGWVSDRRGYRYDPIDPDSGRPWPTMPELFHELAEVAAMQAGFDGFVPDVCLINRYVPGARLTLHQDRDERDGCAPIVSVSLGLPAVFQFGGPRRGDPTRRIPLMHGDVAVWGGPARFFHHGVLPLKPGCHPLTGEQRINLTFRRAR